MTITPVRIGDKIELYGEIYGKEIGDMNLSACRLTFREITRMFNQDGIGDGFWTLTFNQAKQLYDDLGVILRGPDKGEENE